MAVTVASGALLRGTGLVRAFERGERVTTAIGGLDFTIHPGEFVLVQGPVGAGKTVLLHVLGGLERPTSGGLVINQLALENVPEKVLAAYRSRDVGYIGSRALLCPDLTAEENLRLRLALAGAPAWQQARRSREILVGMGLGDLLRIPVRLLSISEQAWVGLAVALAPSPTLLIADDPAQELSTSERAEFVDTLVELHKATGQTIIFASEDPPPSLVPDRTFRMEQGHIIRTTGATPNASADDAAITTHVLRPPHLSLRWLGRLLAYLLTWGAARLALAAVAMILAVWIIWMGIALATPSAVESIINVSGGSEVKNLLIVQGNPAVLLDRPTGLTVPPNNAISANTLTTIKKIKGVDYAWAAVNRTIAGNINGTNPQLPVMTLPSVAAPETWFPQLWAGKLPASDNDSSILVSKNALPRWHLPVSAKVLGTSIDLQVNKKLTITLTIDGIVNDGKTQAMYVPNGIISSIDGGADDAIFVVCQPDKLGQVRRVLAGKGFHPSAPVDALTVAQSSIGSMGTAIGIAGALLFLLAVFFLWLQFERLLRDHLWNVVAWRVYGLGRRQVAMLMAFAGLFVALATMLVARILWILPAIATSHLVRTSVAPAGLGVHDTLPVLSQAFTLTLVMLVIAGAATGIVAAYHATRPSIGEMLRPAPGAI